MLGPLRVVGADGAEATPHGRLQRRLLALLVLHRGRVVTADAAIEALWPSDLPSDPEASLQNHMFRLRRHLPGAIASTAAGYRLERHAVDVDVDRLAAALDAGRHAEVAELLLGWHGPAYVDLDGSDVVGPEASRLDELRVRAEEAVAAAALAAGDHVAALSRVRAIVDEHPLRERPRELLIDALAGDGRVAEALRAYDDFRRVLGDQLGTEPSAHLAARAASLLGTVVPPAPAPAPLPHANTSLVGRDALTIEVAEAVEAGRVVTLVGPGGVGKTRLLVEVGHRLVAHRPGRQVVLCELATAGTRDAFDVVAAALSIDSRPGVALADRIAEVIGGDELVLLLDNCEHVLDVAAELTERLVGRCPRLRIVATSRERLRVGGEHVCVVPTLALGGAGTPAVELFVERARAAGARLDLNAGGLQQVVSIVARLDGLPLAIELAAARLHTHTLDEVAAGLDDRFALLTGGLRTSPRHGSLAAAVSWSFGLLSPELQDIFAALSVFAGPFSAADAAAVAGLQPGQAAIALTELVERSLVLRAHDRRYALLETLRAFGGEHLRTTARAAEVGDRHLRHQVTWVADARHRMLEPGSRAIAEIEAALPELRAALTWALAHGRVELAGRLVAPLLDYAFMRLRPDVLEWAERVTDADPDDASPVAASVWVVAAYSAWMTGDVTEFGARAAHAQRLAERAGGPLPTDVLTAAASFELFRGNLTAARALYREAADTPAPNDPARPLMAAASEILARGYARDDADAATLAAEMIATTPRETPYAAYVWYCAGEADLAVDPERARQRFAMALDVAERTAATFVVGTAGASKASLDARTGDPVDAAAAYRRLIVHWRRAGMWSTQWTMLRSIAGLLARLGRHRDAAVLEGAIRGTLAGHRIFGADEVALDELSRTLTEALGAEEYADALRTGATLDGNAAAEHAFAAL